MSAGRRYLDDVRPAPVRATPLAVAEAELAKYRAWYEEARFVDADRAAGLHLVVRNLALAVEQLKEEMSDAPPRI